MGVASDALMNLVFVHLLAKRRLQRWHQRSPRSHDCRRSQKLPKNAVQGRRFPAHLWIIIIFQGVLGGRTRARTWDPLIKSQRLKMLGIGPNQQ
jgi:hypothetical protein